MAEEKSINGIRGWSILVSAILASLAGSSGGTYYYLNNITPQELQKLARPDPATGTQFKSLQREIEYHVNNHPDVVNQFDRRLTRIETQLEIVIQNQNLRLHK